MKQQLLILCILPLLLTSICIRGSFQTWKERHGKVYDSEIEHNYRLGVYQKNLEFIENHNRKNLGFVVAMNEFGDLTSEEFAALYLGTSFNASERKESEDVFTFDENLGLADAVDWRTKGAVTAIKNQGQCGSCWAFSTTGSVEGAWFIKKNKLVSLSEQNLVDCSKSGNHGCQGGLMDYAFKYIISNKGIDTEDSYKYTARDGTCKFSSSNVGATLTSYRDIAKGSESALTQAIQNIGPISVAIDASQSSFQFYHSGVYNEPRCSSSRLDHGVLAVGYGTDSSSNKDYYIVKNSWGTSWGMNGYILMSRNKNNQCGIATASSYPIV